MKFLLLLSFFFNVGFFVDDVPRLFFKDFRSYDLKKMIASEDMKAYDGKKIQVIGFMMPFESVENIDKFMLLQAPFMGCFHLPPPQAHETLLVESTNLNVNYDQYPQTVEGILTIEKTEIEGYLVSVYTIKATKVSRADYKDLETTGLAPGAHMQSDF